MSSPVQMSLSFATNNLVVLSFPPEVISYWLYLSHMMGCPGKSSRETSFVNSSVVASWVAHSISSSRSSLLKRDFFAASLEKNPATQDAVRNSSLLNILGMAILSCQITSAIMTRTVQLSRLLDLKMCVNVSIYNSSPSRLVATVKCHGIPR